MERVQGDATPKAVGGDRRSLRMDRHAGAIRALVDETPDITIEELRTVLAARGVSASLEHPRQAISVRRLWRLPSQAIVQVAVEGRQRELARCGVRLGVTIAGEAVGALMDRVSLGRPLRELVACVDRALQARFEVTKRLAELRFERRDAIQAEHEFRHVMQEFGPRLAWSKWAFRLPDREHGQAMLGDGQRVLPF
jgi:hypothetical protein